MLNFKGGEKVPALEVATVGGGNWSLAAANPKGFSLIVFYRGLHCPQCKRYLGELESKLAALEELGVVTIALSADTEERATKAKSEWGLGKLAVGHSLPTAKAREWGLFISRATRDTEPSEFNEPGLFLVRPDGTLQACCVGNTPWARPPLDGVIAGIKTSIERGSAPRGEA